MVPGTLSSQIPACTGICAVSGQRLEPGDAITVALIRRNGQLERLDALKSVANQLPSDIWASWQTVVADEVQEKTGGQDTDLLSLVNSEETPPEVRWDACQRLIRRRKMVLARVPKESGMWLARSLETGQESILRAPLYGSSS
jgi:hypothetical protein